MDRELEALISQIATYKGLTKKTSERFVLGLIVNPQAQQQLAGALEKLGSTFSTCLRCFGIAKNKECLICDNPRRNQQLICVVSEVGDMLNIEKYQQFNGVYAVLQGEIKLNRNIGPNQLKIEPLLERAQAATEIILALNNTFEGEVTANYLAKLLAPIPNLNISRLGKGMPMGGMIDYIDENTLFNALANRKKVED